MVTRPVVFSASSVNAYQTCHLQWYFEYVLVEPGIVSEAQTVGIMVHDYAENRLHWKRDRGWVIREKRATHEVHLIYDVFDRDILPTYRDAVLIEAPFQIEVDGIPFSGVIDSVDRQDVGLSAENLFTDVARLADMGDGAQLEYMSGMSLRYANILRDLKTTGKRPPPGKYWFAMIGYFLGARDLGFEIAAIQLDYIVRTQKPYYWPEVVSVPDDDDIARWASVLQDVAEGVERADYEPTGLGTYVCNFCPYRMICGPFQRYNAAQKPL